MPGKCDVCGGELQSREDDTEEALARRLSDYHEKTNPVLDIFRRKEYVITVDARPPARVVQQEIRRKLDLPALPEDDQHGQAKNGEGRRGEAERRAEQPQQQQHGADRPETEG